MMLSNDGAVRCPYCNAWAFRDAVSDGAIYAAVSKRGSSDKSPTTTTACPIAAAVAADVLARAEVGLRKYGVSLARPDLSRAQWLQHAYEEALDLANYLKTLIEMEKANVRHEA
jgi:hypothetical protein